VSDDGPTAASSSAASTAGTAAVGDAPDESPYAAPDIVYPAPFVPEPDDAYGFPNKNHLTAMEDDADEASAPPSEQLENRGIAHSIGAALAKREEKYVSGPFVKLMDNEVALFQDFPPPSAAPTASHAAIGARGGALRDAADCHEEQCQPATRPSSSATVRAPAATHAAHTTTDHNSKGSDTVCVPGAPYHEARDL
jgi:hypothetical protein